jgi:predicted transcriptional regulator
MPRSGRRTTTGSRLDLDDPLKGEFADYLAAKDDASQKTVVHRAIRAYIEADLEKNAGLKERYEELRRARRDGHAPNLHLIKPEKTC